MYEVGKVVELVQRGSVTTGLCRLVYILPRLVAEFWRQIVKADAKPGRDGNKRLALALALTQHNILDSLGEFPNSFFFTNIANI